MDCKVRFPVGHPVPRKCLGMEFSSDLRQPEERAYRRSPGGGGKPAGHVSGKMRDEFQSAQPSG